MSQSYILLISFDGALLPGIQFRLGLLPSGGLGLVVLIVVILASQAKFSKFVFARLTHKSRHGKDDLKRSAMA